MQRYCCNHTNAGRADGTCVPWDEQRWKEKKPRRNAAWHPILEARADDKMWQPEGWSVLGSRAIRWLVCCTLGVSQNCETARSQREECGSRPPYGQISVKDVAGSLDGWAEQLQVEAAGLQTWSYQEHAGTSAVKVSSCADAALSDQALSQKTLYLPQTHISPSTFVFCQSLYQ